MGTHVRQGLEVLLASLKDLTEARQKAVMMLKTLTKAQREIRSVKPKANFEL